MTRTRWLLLLLLSLCALAACAHDDRPARAAVPASADATAAPAPRPHPSAPQAAVVLDGTGGPTRVAVELALRGAQRQRGLMYRDYLPSEQGMLFVFEREEPQTFWMHNTLIPLDMIFIRSDMTVAGVVENAEPMTDTSRKVDTPSQYVLEVNGGWARQHGVKAGTVVHFENVPLK